MTVNNLISDLDNTDVASVYNSIVLDYERASRYYWSIYSHRTIDKLQLTGKETVLDLACGTGASALIAAAIVGPENSVVALDNSRQMLDLLKKKAECMGYDNINFVHADMANIKYNQQFDVLICVFGIFFSSDMVRQLDLCWKALKPGGKMAITFFGYKFLSPIYEVWKDLMKQEAPDLNILAPWERLTENNIENLCSQTQLQNIKIDIDHNTILLGEPEEWWYIVMTTGMRQYISAIGKDSIERVRTGCIRWLINNNISVLNLDVMYLQATKDNDV